MNLCLFKPYRVYLDPLNLSNVGDFSQFYFLWAFTPLKKRKIRRRIFTAVKRRIKRFHVVVVQWTSRKFEV